MTDILNEVETAFSQEPFLARNVKIFLCHKYTGEKLKAIGKHFGIEESGVSHASRRIKDKIKSDKKLKRKISKIEKRLFL